jgi:hypothetical protein
MQIQKLLGHSVLAETQADIFLVTGRYVNMMELRSRELDASDVAKACTQLRDALSKAEGIVRTAITKPGVGGHLKFLVASHLDDDWMGRLSCARDALSYEVRRCNDPDHAVDANPWDAWVADVAEAWERAGFEVRVLNYEDATDDRSPTTFMQLVELLQLDLPEWLGQHESSRGRHRWQALAKAIQRALKPRRLQQSSSNTSRQKSAHAASAPRRRARRTSG